MSLRIVNWNLEWAPPRRSRGQELRRRIEQTKPEVVCLTESHSDFLPDGHVILAHENYGYPFHPVGKPERLRVDHLPDLKTPTLIVQGERDAFGSKNEVASYELSPTIQVHWLPDGDHSFTPRKASGRTEEQNWEQGRAVVEKFGRSLQV